MRRATIITSSARACGARSDELLCGNMREAHVSTQQLTFYAAKPREQLVREGVMSSSCWPFEYESASSSCH